MPDTDSKPRHPVAPFTPEATLGPFYPGIFVSLMPKDLSVVAPVLAHRPQGRRITLSGRFFDSLGRPVPSLVMEVWQANSHGRYRHPQDRSRQPLDPQFEGFARLRTDDAGAFRYATIKPGPHPVEEGRVAMRAPHIRLTIFASGIDRVVTQVFFEDEPANAADPVLNSIPDPAVRSRLIARRKDSPEPTGRGGGAPRQELKDHAVDGVLAYELDFILRGDGETPFFDDWT